MSSSISKYPEEDEILFLTFTFYHLKDVKISLEKCTLDIELEVIGRLEVLEEEIKKGNTICYKQLLDIICVEGKEEEKIIKKKLCLGKYSKKNFYYL